MNNNNHPQNPQQFPNLQSLLRLQDSITPNPNPSNPNPNAVIPFNILNNISSTSTSTPTPKPKLPRIKKPAPINTSTSAIPPCTECGKLFSSWKALFGHMRCHPERHWRGINPPPDRPIPNQNQTNLTFAFTPDEYEVASSLVLLSNGTKGKRRRFEDEQAAAAVREEHTCGVCRKGFSSGQALGGHMRSHGENAAITVMGSSSSGKELVVLDLNLPPPHRPLESTSELDLRLGM